jgi:hypothetical protein
MQVADTNGLSQVAIGARSLTTTRIVAVKGRAAACNIALFGRSALASDMPPLRDTARRPGLVRPDPLSSGGGRTPAIRHHRARGLYLFLSRGKQER